MITLITGGPGLGKTALAVKMLTKDYPDRPIFTNINALTLPHEPRPPLAQWTEKRINAQGTHEFHYTFPPGAVVVIDECQQFFRPRASGAQVPPYIQAFETHRHAGIDFLLMTQGSRLVDSNLRSLIKGGKHIVLRSSFLGRYQYERSEVIDEESKASLDLASRRRYKLPSEVYSLYKSSELHTKPPRPKMPIQAYVLVAAVVIGGVLFWQGKESIEKKTTAAVPAAPAKHEPGRQDEYVNSAPASLALAVLPVDRTNHLSAPLYAASLPEPVLPYVAGCVSSKTRCSCFTDKSVKIHSIDPVICRLRASGDYHDPYPAPSFDSAAGETMHKDMAPVRSASDGLDGAPGAAG